MPEDNGLKLIATNRRARHEYHIEETLEVGVVLTGTEIKSIRAGHASVQDAYVSPEHGELWIQNLYIAPYDPGKRESHEPRRPRKLLAHRREIEKLAEAVQQKGLTIIALRLYLKRGRAKLEIALAKGKKLFDKRQSIAERDAKSRIERALSDHRRER